VARSPRTAVTGGHAWTDEQDAELRDGVESGCTLEELADHLELAPDLVTARMTLLGLELSDAPTMSFD
jgi:ATP-dependent DNA helicase DinG